MGARVPLFGKLKAHPCGNGVHGLKVGKDGFRQARAVEAEGINGGLDHGIVDFHDVGKDAVYGDFHFITPSLKRLDSVSVRECVHCPDRKTPFVSKYMVRSVSTTDSFVPPSAQE